jgi:hypothetical protein
MTFWLNGVSKGLDSYPSSRRIRKDFIEVIPEILSALSAFRRTLEAQKISPTGELLIGVHSDICDHLINFGLILNGL